MAVCTIITSIKVVTCVSSQQRQQHRRGDTSHSEGSETPRTGFAAPGLFPRWLSGYQPPTLGSSSASFGRTDELELGLLPENQAPLLTAPWQNIWWPPQTSQISALWRNIWWPPFKSCSPAGWSFAGGDQGTQAEHLSNTVLDSWQPEIFKCFLNLLNHMGEGRFILSRLIHGSKHVQEVKYGWVYPWIYGHTDIAMHIVRTVLIS